MNRVAAAVVVACLFACVGCDESSTGGTTQADLKGGGALDGGTLPGRAEVQATCVGPFRNHGQCVSCVAHAANALNQSGAIPTGDVGAIVSSFAHGECRASCIPTTCAIAGASCGSIDDLCGGTLDCAACGPAESCADAQCVAAP